MVKVVNIVGTRPQIIKASALSRAIRQVYNGKIKEVIVDTGQHYDRELSAVFFQELNIPQPHYSLNTGSESHGKQTAEMLTGLENILLKEKPDCAILYGDTNSTLAAALAAVKIQCPVVHIEAGLRSFNKSMPEEINRLVCDHVSTLLFSPTNAGYANLIREGFDPDSTPPFNIDNPCIYHCGDIMYDNSIYFSQQAENHTEFLKSLGVEKGNYLLATVHRDHNTDDPSRLKSIFSAFSDIATRDKIHIIIPLHPRTMKALDENLEGRFRASLKENEYLRIIPPVSYIEMIILEKNSRMIITDSGGVQKEAHFFGKSCIVLRPETEWIELVNNKTAYLADADIDEIQKGYSFFSSKKNFNFPKFFGDGKTAEFICEELMKNFIN